MAQLRQHGCAMTSKSLAGILGRMSRNGWVKVASVRATSVRGRRRWYLSAKGRTALGLAIKQLEQLAAKWPNNPKHKQ